MQKWQELIPEELKNKYELYNFNHAVEILTQAYPVEWSELLEALVNFNIATGDILKGGGNESNIPKLFSNVLRKYNWREVKISGDLIVKLQKSKPKEIEERTIEDFIDGHKIDYIKGEVAFDLEWNSKDQTFDRDLYAFRTFYECGIIKCGIIVTRSDKLNPVFQHLGVMHKYGASTTWIGKLLPRINSGRHGGCPLLIVCITPAAIIDLEGNNDGKER